MEKKLNDKSTLQLPCRINFQDGNGRVGRLILFRKCLRHSIMPFVIDNEHKMYYYRGLSEFRQTPGFLVGTMQSAQDVYEAWIRYFNEDLLEGLRVEYIQPPLIVAGIRQNKKHLQNYCKCFFF